MHEHICWKILCKEDNYSWHNRHAIHSTFLKLHNSVFNSLNDWNSNLDKITMKTTIFAVYLKFDLWSYAYVPIYKIIGYLMHFFHAGIYYYLKRFMHTRNMPNIHMPERIGLSLIVCLLAHTYFTLLHTSLQFWYAPNSRLGQLCLFNIGFIRIKVISGLFLTIARR